MAESETVVGELDLDGKLFAWVSAGVVDPLAPHDQGAERLDVRLAFPPAVFQLGERCRSCRAFSLPRRTSQRRARAHRGPSRRHRLDRSRCHRNGCPRGHHRWVGVAAIFAETLAQGPRLGSNGQQRHRARRLPTPPAPPNPNRISRPGRVAQWESARFTRERSQVRNPPRPLLRLERSTSHMSAE